MLDVMSRMSISVMGDCCFVKTPAFWECTATSSVFVKGLCCITAACWSIARKQTLAFHLSVGTTADSRLAGMFLVEIFVGFNDVVFCSVLILKKCELVMFKSGYCV